MVCTARACARRVKPRPFPSASFLFPNVARLRASKGACAQTPTRPLVRPAVRLPHGGCTVVSHRAPKLGSGARCPWPASLKSRLAASRGCLYFGTACWAKLRDPGSSPFCPVVWCAGAAVHTPATSQSRCAQRVCFRLCPGLHSACPHVS